MQLSEHPENSSESQSNKLQPSFYGQGTSPCVAGAEPSSKTTTAPATPESIAQDFMDKLCKRVIYVTATQKQDFTKYLANPIRPYVSQPTLFAGLVSTDDEQAFRKQSQAILNLLKERKSYGAFNHELAKVCLKYTGRVSDLRKQGYKITCNRNGVSRTFLYILAPEHW